MNDIPPENNSFLSLPEQKETTPSFVSEPFANATNNYQPQQNWRQHSQSCRTSMVKTLASVMAPTANPKRSLLGLVLVVLLLVVLRHLVVLSQGKLCQFRCRLLNRTGYAYAIVQKYIIYIYVTSCYTYVCINTHISSSSCMCLHKSQKNHATIHYHRKHHDHQALKQKSQAV